MKKLMIAGAAGVMALGSALAVAQGQDAPAEGLSCAGKVVTFRYSEIKPGKLDAFKKAVAAHGAWYAANKNGTKVNLVRMMKREGGKLAYDDSAAMTMVVYDPRPQPSRDAAYTAFVKAYRDSSTVKEEHRGCLG